MKDHPYALLWVSVKAGHGDEAVDAARKAGARGGTVLKGSRCSTEEASSFLGISIRDEQDFVMIVVPQEPEIRRHAGSHRRLRPEHPRPRCNSRPAGR